MAQQTSSFWLGANVVGDDTANRAFRLAGYQRAISNFVRIATGRTDIPVKYSTDGNSMTDGKTVILSANVEKVSEFDSIVGLALHEGSHIVYTDFSVLPAISILDSGKFTCLKKVYSACNNSKKNVHIYNEVLLKTLLNVIEDRRIDQITFDNAPGYRGYYKAMYNRYFNALEINKALEFGLKDNPNDIDDYLFHIINFSNPRLRLDTLPGLKEIWDMIDIHNIRRLSNTAQALEVAVDVYVLLHKIIFENQTVDSAKSNNSGTIDKKTDSTKSNNSGTGDSENDGAGSSENEGAGSSENEEKTYSDKEKETLRKKIETILNKALKTQRDFINDELVKKSIPKNIVDKVDVAIKICGNTVPVGGGNVNKTECLVIEGISKEIIDSGLLSGHCLLEQAKAFQDCVEAGISFGMQLSKRLKTRDEERSLTASRLLAGQIDKRLIAELGFGNENVFSKTVYYKSSPTHIHISLDASGSMSGDAWLSSLKTAIAIAKAATMTSSIDVVISLRGTAGRSPLMWVIYDSKKDKLNVVKKFYGYLRPSAGTPEGLCFEAISKRIIKDSIGKDSYFINISDGEPGFNGYCGSSALEHTRMQVDKFRAAGIKIQSYYISGECDTAFNKFVKMYGKDSRLIDVNSLSVLAKSLNELLERKVP